MICRVDERLIHGQVVLGWASHLDLTEYLVVDDDLAGSEWERELYELAVPPTAHAEFLTVAEASQRLADGSTERDQTIVLARSIETVVELAKAGALDGIPVDVGGLHHAPDRKQVLSYVYLSREDLERLRRLASLGLVVYAQDLPASPRVGVDALLSRGQAAWAR